jgi:hypothetical protein
MSHQSTHSTHLHAAHANAEGARCGGAGFLELARLFRFACILAKHLKPDFEVQDTRVPEAVATCGWLAEGGSGGLVVRTVSDIPSCQVLQHKTRDCSEAVEAPCLLVLLEQLL